MFDFGSIRKSVQSLAGQLSSIQKKIERLKQEREFLTSAPLTRAELVGNIHMLVDRQGSAFPKRLGRALAGLKHKPFYDYANSRLDLIGTQGTSSVANTLPKENCAWFLSDLLKARINDAVEIMDWAPDSECGPPLEERRPSLEKIELEIVSLQEELAQLRQLAESSGLHIARL